MAPMIIVGKMRIRALRKNLTRFMAKGLSTKPERRKKGYFTRPNT